MDRRPLALGLLTLAACGRLGYPPLFGSDAAGALEWGTPVASAMAGADGRDSSDAGARDVAVLVDGPPGGLASARDAPPDLTPAAPTDAAAVEAALGLRADRPTADARSDVAAPPDVGIPVGPDAPALLPEDSAGVDWPVMDQPARPDAAADAPAWVDAPIDAAPWPDASTDLPPPALDTLDAALGDAASDDLASVPDAAADVGIAGDAGADALLGPLCLREGPTALACWDFDDPSFTGPVTSEGTGVRDTSRAAAGPASFRATTAGDGRTNAISVEQRLAAPIGSGTIYMRAYFYFPTVLPLIDWAIPMEMKSGSSKISFDLWGDHPAIEVTGVPSVQGVNPYPRDRWVCVQLESDIHLTAGEARLLLDGQLVARVSGVRTRFGGGMDFLRAGIVSAPANPSLSIGVDEVLFSTRPLPCP